MLKHVLPIALVVLLSGCGDRPMAPEFEHVVSLGFLRWAPDAPSAEVPSLVQVNQYFRVTVHTQSKDACARKGHTSLTVTGLRALVTPYDTILVPRRGSACSDLSENFEHEVEIVFTHSGNAVVEVVGLQPGSTDTIRHEFPITITN